MQAIDNLRGEIVFGSEISMSELKRLTDLGVRADVSWEDRSNSVGNLIFLMNRNDRNIDRVTEFADWAEGLCKERI